MAIPISASSTPLNAEAFFQEGFELSLDAIVPSIELTGSYSQFESKTQFYIYNYAKTILYTNLNYNSNGSYLQPQTGTATTTSSISVYNQFELNPTEDIYNQGYSTGKYYAAYNFIDYELGSEVLEKGKDGNYEQHPYFIKDISGDRTELRIQNNYLNSQQIETYYNEFKEKLDARENVDEFYISFAGNRNFIGINSQLEAYPPGSNNPTSILIKLYKPLPIEFLEEMQLQIITKVGETQVFEVEFNPNLEYVDNLLSLKGPNYNVDVKDRINNSTNFKTLQDLINTNSSQSYYQFNSLQDEKGVFLRKNWGDWNEFVKYSSAEQRLNNFYDKMVSIESSSAEILELETITGTTPFSPDYSSSYNALTNNINSIISKFDSYEYFLYYVTGSESWPKYSSTYPYANYSVSSSAVLNWFGSTDENSAYYNSGKNQIYSASRYDNNNQDYLYYLIPPYITENLDNDQYIKFVNMTGQSFDEMYLYTEAIEQVRNTNSGLTGSVLPLGLADEVITSLGFDTYSNDFNSIGFNVNGIGVLPSAGDGLEYITRYVDIASGSVINYYDQRQSTLGYVVALSDPSFPYPLENAAQEIYKRIFHNMVSLVKRKGTVTGLRQLINVWGVPNTMLRISEFGGKNKDDQNDYDLWMNRYSNALTTYNYKKGALLPSGSIRIPWTPLTSNYYEDNGATPPDVAVPDCIQFRFKNARPVYSNSNFTSSLLVKNSVNNANYSDFGIVLQYSGSQSGSYSGSMLPTDNQYGTMQFVIEGDTAQGATSPGYFESDPISLPFFDGGWWSVQLQRKVHLSGSNQDSTLNEYELKVANNIYDGYNGNEIGFQGSASITMPGGNITSSINEAWNKFAIDTSLPSARGIALGGYMTYPSGTGLYNTIIGGAGGRSLGTGFSGSFQEFRYYRRAMSASSFNDYVMNPESIQGHQDSNTGQGSSYDLLSYRLPLGNELEYLDMSGSAGFTTATENTKAIGILKFGGTPDFVNYPSFGANALGSVHPSLVNKKGELYTSSFLYLIGYYTGSGYAIVYQGWDGTDTSAVTASYLSPNTEINYMDQPSAGIRNRIKNKIQVIDGNEYGTILSPFRSIQQEFEQSASYTEDLNSLEVGFSFQNEINDDIIATFGHGVVSDAIADPRFISESSDRYPELTRIAEDYFKKYQGIALTDPRYTGLPTVIEKEYDYNRLIKFYETSLFKAIKNYVPARTSLSTGIIVKQHLLERNKTDAVIGMHTDTPIAKTPETGSNSWGYTSQTGFNSVISKQNLLITSSINMFTITGSAGGSVNEFNKILQPSGSFVRYSKLLTWPNNIWNNITNQYSDFGATDGYYQNNEDFVIGSGSGLYPMVETGTSYNLPADVTPGPYSKGGLENSFMTVTRPLDVSIFFKARSFTFNNTFDWVLQGSKRGTIIQNNVTMPGGGSDYWEFTTDLVTLMPDERYGILVRAQDGTDQIYDVSMSFNPIKTIEQGGNDGQNTGGSNTPGTGNGNILNFSSKQATWYLDDFTGDLKIKNTQEEFYDGEFSGSNIEVIPPQYNPYRIYADGNDINPDTLGSSDGEITVPIVNFNNGGMENGSSIDATFVPVVGSNGKRIKLTVGTTPTNGYVYYTGSISGLVEGQEYEVKTTITLNDFDDEGFLLIGFNRNAIAPTDVMWPAIASGPVTLTFTNFRNYTPTFGSFSNTKSFTFRPNETAPLGNDANNIIGFYYNAAQVGKEVTIEIDYIRPIGPNPKHFYPRDAFTIVPSASLLFQNSPYNPIINNISESRPNSYLYDMDFDSVEPGDTLIEGIPSDYSLLISSSQLGWLGTATNENLLEYVEVPDSNYTVKAITNPRYNGSKVTSADYNFAITQISLSESKVPTGIYSPLVEIGLQKSSKIRFLNGETGSWGGDTTNEFQSAIETRPISFAHFKTSYESLELKDSTTFEIDYLVQIPFESIQGEQAPIITGSILNSNNENLIPVASTFVPNRKLKAYYNNATKQFRNFKFFQTPTLSTTTSPILNYGAEKPESKYILFPAQEIVSEFTNQKSDITVSLTSSFNIPLWMASSSVNYTKTIGATGDRWDLNSTRNGFVGGNMNTFLFNLSQSIVPAPLNERSGSITLAVTGSSPTGDKEGYGLLYLQGYATQGQNMVRIIPSNPNLLQSYYALSGPHLAMINSLNININNGNIADVDSPNYGAINANQNATFSSVAQVGFPMVAGTGEIIVNPGVGPAVGNYKSPLPVLPTLGRSGTKGLPNYFTFNYSSSAMTEYQNKRLPIMIERGDEIQVTYANTYGGEWRGVDGLPNALGNYRYDTVNFTVLGYEQPAPNLLVNADYYWPLTDSGYSPFYSQSNGTQIPFNVLINNLPEKGIFSPDSLVEKLNIMAYNSQSLFGGNTQSDLDTTWSGSIISASVEARVGEISGSSTIPSPSGSVRLALTGSRWISPYLGTENVVIFSDTLTYRATNYGNFEGGEDTLSIETYQSPSKYQYAADGTNLDPGFIFDTLKVSPNPATLPTPILSGSIMSMTIKKRIDNDMRVVVDMNQPAGSKGVLTPSGDGYLIPDDLTTTQQDNVVKLINVLKSQNAFTNPPDANETQDVS
jgi:hypothetical protein